MMTKTALKFILGFLFVLLCSFGIIAIAGHITQNKNPHDTLCSGDVC